MKIFVLGAGFCVGGELAIVGLNIELLMLSVMLYCLTFAVATRLIQFLKER